VAPPSPNWFSFPLSIGVCRWWAVAYADLIIPFPDSLFLRMDRGAFRFWETSPPPFRSSHAFFQIRRLQLELRWRWFWHEQSTRYVQNVHANKVHPPVFMFPLLTYASTLCSLVAFRFLGGGHVASCTRWHLVRTFFPPSIHEPQACAGIKPGDHGLRPLEPFNKQREHDPPDSLPTGLFLPSQFLFECHRAAGPRWAVRRVLF